MYIFFKPNNDKLKWLKMFKSKSKKTPLPVDPPTLKNNKHVTQNNNQNNPSSRGANFKTNAPPPYSEHDSNPSQNSTRSMLSFSCQLAHGSPTGFVSGFANAKELFQKIGDAFEIPPSEILFCTLNTHKVDMRNLLGGQIGLDDFIFAHVKGTPKEIELVKSEDALGLTITDNGGGYAFIKRIKDGSVIHSISLIQIGDHIEKLNGESMVGKRHFEVARILKDIPKGSTFSIRLVEPVKSGFINIGTKNSSKTGKNSYGNGKQTLRFKAGGKAEIQKQDDRMDAGIEQINKILENFLGINDAELATQIWDHSVGKNNSMEFADAIDASDLEIFGFTDDIVIEMWGAVTDARDGRI